VVSKRACFFHSSPIFLLSFQLDLLVSWNVHSLINNLIAAGHLHYPHLQSFNIFHDVFNSQVILGGGSFGELGGSNYHQSSSGLNMGCQHFPPNSVGHCRPGRTS
jgi:hypothetical protein